MVIQPTSSDFVLSFDGPALTEGRMAVGELAPSLLALGALFQEANRIVDPTAPPVTLEVRASDRGSFTAELHVASSTLVSFFTSDPVVATGLLAGLMISQGAHPKVIQERLGHSSIKVTLDTYGHLFPNLDEALAGALDELARTSAASAPPTFASQLVLAGRRSP
jgi:hypothetical protein